MSVNQQIYYFGVLLFLLVAFINLLLDTLRRDNTTLTKLQLALKQLNSEFELDISISPLSLILIAVLVSVFLWPAVLVLLALKLITK